MKYKITYERKTTKYFWTFASEIIEARGLVHAHSLANRHLNELRKTDKNQMRIKEIKQMEE